MVTLLNLERLRYWPQKLYYSVYQGKMNGECVKTPMYPLLLVILTLKKVPFQLSLGAILCFSFFGILVRSSCLACVCDGIPFFFSVQAVLIF